MAQELRLYRPRQTNNGTALIFQVNQKEKKSGEKTFKEWCLFLVAGQQTGNDGENPTYAWNDEKKTATVKLGETDTAAILAVLQGRRESAKLFHKNKRGDTTLNVTFDEAKGIYYFNVSARRDGSEPIKVNQGVTIEESILVEEVLRGFLRMFYFAK